MEQKPLQDLVECPHFRPIEDDEERVVGGVCIKDGFTSPRIPVMCSPERRSL